MAEVEFKPDRLVVVATGEDRTVTIDARKSFKVVELYRDTGDGYKTYQLVGDALDKYLGNKQHIQFPDGRRIRNVFKVTSGKQVTVKGYEKIKVYSIELVPVEEVVPYIAKQEEIERKAAEKALAELEL